MAQSNQHVEIKVVTWTKDSHGLFDYESKSIDVKKFKIEKSGQIYREGEQITICDKTNAQSIQKDQTKFMTSIVHKDDAQPEEIANNQASPYYLYPKVNNTVERITSEPIKVDTTSDNFLIVRSLKNKDGQQKGYVLSPGDIIKLGRIEYLVHEISDGKQTNSVKNCPQSELHHVYEVKEEEINQSMMMSNEGSEQVIRQCKICLMDDQSEDNFFISPCKCKGSCQYVHFQCLKTWVESKIKKKLQGNTVAYNWKKSECELCNAPLPKKIKNRGEELELIAIERPQCPYLLLESLAKDKKVSKNLFLITSVGEEQEAEKVCLGRGHQCEVRISDISVSRQHAYIKYQNNNFVITDNNSKFGTLIQMKNPIPITSDKVAIQVGRTVITFVLRPDQKAQISDQQIQNIPIGSTSTIGSNNNLQKQQQQQQQQPSLYQQQYSINNNNNNNNGGNNNNNQNINMQKTNIPKK